MEKKNKCVIVGGASIPNYSKVMKYLSPDDYYIFCDGGLYHLEKMGVDPDLIVGDFDSFVGEVPKDVEVIRLPCEKDDTDSFFAAKEGLRRGFKEFVLIGVLGDRIDHTLGNVSMMYMLKENNASGIMIDNFSEIELIGSEPTYVDSKFSYFSIINLDGTARGITVENARYPLDNAEISWSYQYGVSNKTINDEPAKITLKEGTALLIKVF